MNLKILTIDNVTITDASIFDTTRDKYTYNWFVKKYSNTYEETTFIKQIKQLRLLKLKQLNESNI